MLGNAARSVVDQCTSHQMTALGYLWMETVLEVESGIAPSVPKQPSKHSSLEGDWRQRGPEGCITAECMTVEQFLRFLIVQQSFARVSKPADRQRHSAGEAVTTTRTRSRKTTWPFTPKSASNPCSGSCFLSGAGELALSAPDGMPQRPFAAGFGESGRRSPTKLRNCSLQEAAQRRYEQEYAELAAQQVKAYVNGLV